MIFHIKPCLRIPSAITRSILRHDGEFCYAFHTDDTGTHLYQSHSGHRKIDGESLIPTMQRPFDFGALRSLWRVNCAWAHKPNSSTSTLRLQLTKACDLDSHRWKGGFTQEVIKQSMISSVCLMHVSISEVLMWKRNQQLKIHIYLK